jgi:adenylate cyclase
MFVAAAADSEGVVADVRHQVIVRTCVPNIALAIGLCVGGAFDFFVATPPLRPGRAPEVVYFTNLAWIVVLLIVSGVVGVRVIIRWVTAATTWLAEGRQPSHSEMASALRLPWRLAMVAYPSWLVAAVAIVAFNRDNLRPGPLVAVGVGQLEVATVAAAMVFVLTQAATVPVLQRGFAGGVAPGHERLATGRELVVLWALTSGLVLALIADIPLMSSGDVRTMLWFACAGGGAVGLTVIAVVARRFGSRVDGLRLALDKVRSGDLDVKVAVDDGGELGVLQAGFNSMVDGLRDRRTLEDLFGRHVGIEVASQARDRGAHLGGEVREVSVLFVDLIGSTTLAQRYEPDQVVGLLNEFFSVVVGSAASAGGWVNKFEGDAALCIFGAPESDEHHEMHALDAARRIQKGIVALHARHPDLDAGIGVSSGAVVAGNVGAEDRYEYTVIGDAVNEAARLTEIAKSLPNRTAASHATVAEAGAEATRWREAATVTLRGRDRPTVVYTTAD